jgi:predicted dehydrogenase
MVRIGFAGVAHMHSYGYAWGLGGKAEVIGVWDPTPELAAKFGDSFGITVFDSLESLLSEVDALIITSENTRHLPIMRQGAAAGRPMLCEKPIVTSEEDARAVLDLVAQGARIMTAFPCRYAAAFGSLKAKLGNGDIGAPLAVCATNRGSCPFQWFVEKELSGGGAMIDHVVHVTDLLRALFGCEVVRVQAQTGNNMYGQEWEDTAMLTLELANGVFATLDSSWSRHKSFKTWGDVTMNVVGDAGVIEMDMFGQEIDLYRDPKHSVVGYGSSADEGLVADFLRFVSQGGDPPISAYDGVQAARVALAGYESARTMSVVEVAA